MRKIGVYGSLREGMHNHCLLENSRMIDKKIINVPFKMVSFGFYPALIPDIENRSHNVMFEIYEVDDDVYKTVEILEGYPDFYDKAWCPEGFEYYYVKDENKYYLSRFEDEESILDWVKYNKKGE